MIPLFDANPTRRTPWLTVSLLTLNTAVFLYQAMSGHFRYSLFTYGAVPMELSHGVDLYPFVPFPVHLTLFSSMFMHGDMFHLIGNMLYLWIFGDNVEDLLGPVKFLIYYLLCGVAAAYAHVWENPTSVIPMVGASGAISGILAAYLLAYPAARVYTFFWFIFFIRIIPLPAWLLIGVWFLLQIASAGGESQVAFGAHVGGFVAGLALFPVFRKL